MSETMRRSGRRGTVLALAVVGLLVMLSSAALTIDVGLAVLAKQQLQSAADAAALAGITSLQSALNADLARQAAVATAAENTVLGQSVELDPAVDLEVGAWDEATGAIIPFNVTGGVQAIPDGVVAMRVTARRTTGSPGGPIALHFSRVLGRTSIDLQANATGGLTISNRPRPAVEVALCQDQSGSFEDEFPSARTAGVALTSFLKDSFITNDKMGYVGFGYQPNSPTTAKKRDTWYFHDTGLKSTEDTTDGSQWLTSYITNVPTVLYSDPTDGYCYTNLYNGMLRSALTFANPTAAGTAWTNFTTSLKVGTTFYNIGWWNTTSNQTIGGVTKQRKQWLYGYIQTLLNSAFENTAAQHTMILCSDGMPWYHSNSFPDTKSKELVVWIADQLAAKNIRIHTVCLDQSSSSGSGSQGADTQFISSLVRNGGSAFFTYDAANLANLMVGVGQVEVGKAHLMQ